MKQSPFYNNERNEEVKSLTEKIWLLRPDLQDAYQDPKSPDFWYWLNWHGRDLFPALARALPFLPPEELRIRTGGGVTDTQHLQSGLVDWRSVVSCLADAGFQYGTSRKVLEFGSGCGRLMRHFQPYSTKLELHGIDVDHDGVSWCEDNLTFARFHLGAASPPTRFPSAYFDAIYALSVFTHLTKDDHVKWMKEIARISSRGSIVVITMHGRPAFEKGTKEVGRFPGADVLSANREVFEREGFLFFPYRSLHFQDASSQIHFESVDLQTYGDSFVSQTVIDRVWSEYFHIRSFSEAPTGWLDFYTLERR